MNKKNKANKNKMHGITLIELMITLTLSMLILGVTITIYLTAQNNLLYQSSLNLMLENIHFMEEIFRSELHLSGYIGCPKLTVDFPIKNIHSYEINVNNALSISKNKKTVTVRHVNVLHANVVEEMKDTSSLSVSLNPLFSKGDILLISDCKKAEIFKVKNSVLGNDIQVITPEAPLQFLYDKLAEVGKLEMNTFYIKDTGRKMENGQAVYALYQEDISHYLIELVENIQEFNVDFDGKGVAINLKMASPVFLKTWRTYIALKNN
jgi:type IV pilus assembly protein PilW